MIMNVQKYGDKACARYTIDILGNILFEVKII
jgi:hypothetical protein